MCIRKVSVQSEPLLHSKALNIIFLHFMHCFDFEIGTRQSLI